MNKKYMEVIIKCMKNRFPLNLIKIMRNFISMAKMKETSSLPFKLQIESAGICNLKCRMCPQNQMKRKKGFLKFEVFKKIYDEIQPPYLNLTGFGEPLMNKDIFKIIDYAKKNRSFVKLDTNGTLLDEKNINNLLDTKIDIISNSIDGMDKKTYERIRIGANFEKVMQNLRDLVTERNKRKSKTEIHLFLVLQKDNFNQFPDFIRFGDAIGADSISGTFIAEESYKENKKYNIENLEQAELEKLKKDIRKAKKEVKANVEIDELIEYIDTWKQKKNKNWSKVPCYVPWYAPFITWDGIVTPCCYCVDKEVVFGDASKESFSKIWNNKKARDFRKMVATIRSGICAKCEADESYIKEFFKKILIFN